MKSSFRFVALFALTCVACGDSGETSGARFQLALRMDIEARTASTRSGWNVELEKAQIAVGALHFFTGEPLGAWNRGVTPPTRALASLWRRAEATFGLGLAHAHPGHYVEGDALGEMLTPITVDLLAGSTPLGNADATSGLYRSARFTFATPPVGSLAAEMGDASLVLEGIARKDTEIRHFRYRLGGSGLFNAAQEPELDGCRFEQAQIDATGTVLVTARPSIWFSAADFTELAPSAEGRPVDIAPDSKLYRQLREQILASAGIALRYE